MLSMCELQDEGKGPYTEISTFLWNSVRISGYFSSGRHKIKCTNCVACLDSSEWKCSLIFFDKKLYTCGTSGLTERADLLSK